jgi:hypothetical protein
MSKALKTRNLAQRNATRSLLAISLSLSLTAFGCTTDRNLGNGDPVTTPGLRTSPTSSPGSGSQSAPSVPPSMTSSSSYNAAQALPTVTPRRSNRVQRLTPDQAAATMAQHQAQPRVRYLGVAYPGGGDQSGLGQSATGHQTGQYRNPALQTRPQLTINSSISSGPVPAVTDGAGGSGGGGGAINAGAFVAGSNGNVGTGVTASATANGTAGANALAPGIGTGNVSAAAPVFAPTTAAGLSPLGASPGARLPLGTPAAGVTPTTAPTAFSARNPDPTISSFPALAAVNSATRTGGATGAVLGTGSNGANTGRANAIGTRATANANAIGNRGGATAATANAVVTTRDASGRIVISNVNGNNNR